MKSKSVTYPPRLLTGLTIVLSLSFAFGQVCQKNKEGMDFSQKNMIKNKFFDQFFIEKRLDCYLIHASIISNANYFNLTEVLVDFEKYSEFMPGYKSIKIKKITPARLLACIHFRASFSPFLSVFTNEIEIDSDSSLYKQCWKQLKPNDTLIIKPFKNAPIHNSGSWEIIRLENGKTKTSYFSVIQPPVPIPSWLYRYIVKKSYVNVFKALFKRAKEIKDKD